MSRKAKTQARCPPRRRLKSSSGGCRHSAPCHLATAASATAAGPLFINVEAGPHPTTGRGRGDAPQCRTSPCRRRAPPCAPPPMACNHDRFPSNDTRQPYSARMVDSVIIPSSAGTLLSRPRRSRQVVATAGIEVAKADHRQESGEEQRAQLARVLRVPIVGVVLILRGLGALGSDRPNTSSAR